MNRSADRWMVKLLMVASVISAIGGLAVPIFSQPPSSRMGDPQRGEVLYNASCVVCHGANAVGKIGPRLAGNPILLNDAAFLEVVTVGRHIMPPLKDTLTSQQLADIQAWLKTLR